MVQAVAVKVYPALTDSDAARLTQCITELMASHAE